MKEREVRIMSLGLPVMHRVRAKFPRPNVEHISEVVSEESDRILRSMRSGQRLGIAIGSRGITDIAIVAKTLVDKAKALGLRPFLFPAMGSHGNSIAEGQAGILASFGITEESMGAPICPEMDTVSLGTSKSGVPIYVAKVAMEADGVLLVNRVKPHTDFHGRWESGLVKMSVIGLGKQVQAKEIHNYGTLGLRDKIPEVAEVTLAKAPIIGGIALVENAYKELAIIKGLVKNEIMAEEPALLVRARELMAHLPCPEMDVLVVDELGKDVSGAGLDTNIIGRMYLFGLEEPEKPKITRIAVLDLTEQTQGNAAGIGLADITTRRVIDKIDYPSTHTNIVTSTFLLRGKLPVYFQNDKEAIAAAVRTSYTKADTCRLIRIRSTAYLEEMLVSEAALPDVRELGWEIGEPIQWDFDDQGNLSKM